MSTFEVPILAIDDVYDHPNADRLSILRIRGYEAITNKLEDGSHRFAKGEPIIYVPEGAVVQERDLKDRGYWNAEQGKGMLAGSQGNRVKAIRLRNVLSQGLVWKVDRVFEATGEVVVSRGDVGALQPANLIGSRDGLLGLEPDISAPVARKRARVGDDVADVFGIVKYEEPIPTSMSGKVVSISEARFDYDIENLKAYPDFFQAGEPVEVTEKLHGTFCRLSHISGLTPRGNLFGDGRVAIASKGLGARGLVFMNCTDNLEGGNVYVRALTAEQIGCFQALAESRYPGCNVHLMGEVFGRGVQDLGYGLTAPSFRVFDVAVSDAQGSRFLAAVDKQNFIEAMGLTRVPVLYQGPFDRVLMDKLSGGTTSIGADVMGVGPNIREGVVITSMRDQAKRDAGLGRTLRPILKHVSEAYLTRKGGTELQ
jgi:RNA ligase (TIGR02306 family)